jgi:hypothetical protein
VVPRTADEIGKLYMVLGKLVISASAKDVHRIGDEMLVNAWMFINGGGATMPLAFAVKQSADHSALTGEVFFGKTLTAENIGGLRGQGRKITGESLAVKQQARHESSGGAGN